jgi:mRNA interferase RelE/StbE
MKVEISEQVLAFVKRQAPEPRRALRLALRGLASERGDIRTLEGPLAGYCRLRVGPFRVVFAYAAEPTQPTCIRCVYAERRDVVYTVFRKMLEERILKG